MTFIRFKRILRERVANTKTIEFILMTDMISQIISQWLHLVFITYKFFIIQTKRKRLMKLILLIQMLAGYR